MTDYKHEFRIRKKARGVAIDIIGSYTSIEDYSKREECVEIKPGIWFYKSDTFLDEEELKWLLKGIKIVYRYILEKSQYKDKTLIVLKSVTFNYCYFQIDALLIAMIEWCCNTFRFAIPEITSEFSQDEDRFVFKIPPL